MQNAKKLVYVGIAMALVILTTGCVKESRKGYKEMQFSASCKSCEKLDGFVSPSQINDEIRKMVGKYKDGGEADNVAIQKSRGVIETYLRPDFIDGGDCPEIDSERWAIDYSYKRKRPALHKGIDIHQPRGTPVRAIANGVVVGKFLNEFNRKGIEIILRHTPEQTGLPFWTYSQYTHLQEMPTLSIGTNVKMGDEIGKTANTGKMGRRVRRDALHFAVLYSKYPEWSNDGVVVTPKDGYFMDPNAFYRLDPPYESLSLAKLLGNQKWVPIPYMNADGILAPSDTKRIWPYVCK
ncbi:Peptidase family M23 [endosymbiont of Ridgeia piscesae]|jgi:murein DD-endopeptidase MepM/ murein hydrolase activator NlpD|uniref:Peptidase family M23 n=3 Tax=endosymbiont of Ridgeia piscesae TaxID=54398 RepID=A0A0T5YWD4_9GAMM|nr:M23 family metallopeptidase [endosymbiont of Ridgeia piscesae]KRT54948.1 Peptidase family M23 [endosymbiont of Ridgeia piscesae]